MVKVASKARKTIAFATSSGSPNRCIGLSAFIWSRNCRAVLTAQALLRAARQAALTARAYAPAGKVVIGYVEDLVITPAVSELRRRHPGAEIGTRHLECYDQRAFAEGQVDVLVARNPLSLPSNDIRMTVLYEEPRMLVVRSDHHLAGRAFVSPEDFAGDGSIVCPHGGTRAIYPTDAYQRSDPGPISAAPVMESFEDRLELVASGQAIAVLPVGDRRSSLRADLATVPVEGVPDSRVVVASTKVGCTFSHQRAVRSAASSESVRMNTLTSDRSASHPAQGSCPERMTAESIVTAR